MPIKASPQPRLIVNNIDEINIGFEWPDGTRIFCKDTLMSYTLLDGVLVATEEAHEAADDPHLSYPLTSGPRDDGTLNRDPDGNIESMVTGGVTKTISRDGDGNIASITDGTKTITLTRDGNGVLIGWAVS